MKAFIFEQTFFLNMENFENFITLRIYIYFKISFSELIFNYLLVLFTDTLLQIQKNKQ